MPSIIFKTSPGQFTKTHKYKYHVASVIDSLGCKYIQLFLYICIGLGLLVLRKCCPMSCPCTSFSRPFSLSSSPSSSSLSPPLLSLSLALSLSLSLSLSLFLLFPRPTKIRKITPYQVNELHSYFIRHSVRTNVGRTLGPTKWPSI